MENNEQPNQEQSSTTQPASTQQPTTNGFESLVQQKNSDYVTQQNIISDLREQYNASINEVKSYKKELEALKEALNALQKQQQNQLQQQNQPEATNPSQGFDIEAYKKQILDGVNKELNDYKTQAFINNEIATTTAEINSQYQTVSQTMFDEFIDWTKQLYGENFFNQMKPQAIRPTLKMLFDNYYQLTIQPKDGHANSLNLNSSSQPIVNQTNPTDLHKQAVLANLEQVLKRQVGLNHEQIQAHLKKVK